MLDIEPFRPVPNGTVSISANGTASGTASLSTANLPGNISLRIHNGGPATVFVEFGGAASVTAITTTSMPVPSGAIEVINVDQCSYAAAITSSGTTATVYFTQGFGL